jgi:hypothetical protein
MYYIHYMTEEMTGDDSHSKKKEKKGKRPSKQKSSNGHGDKGIVIADGTVLDQPDYDWSKVEAKIPKKLRLSASSSKGNQKKSKEHKSSKHKKRTSKAKPLSFPLPLPLPSSMQSPLLNMGSESKENNNDRAEQLKTVPPPTPPPPPTECLSALSLDDGDWNPGYSVPEILSPKNSGKNAAMLDNLLKPPSRTLSTATTGDESIMSEGGWSDAVSSSESEGGY